MVFDAYVTVVVYPQLVTVAFWMLMVVIYHDNHMEALSNITGRLEGPHPTSQRLQVWHSCLHLPHIMAQFCR